MENILNKLIKFMLVWLLILIGSVVISVAILVLILVLINVFAINPIIGAVAFIVLGSAILAIIYVRWG